MKKKKFSLIDFTITGIGIGIPVTLVCMTLIGGFQSAVAEFLVWTVASALFGIISGLVFHTNHNLNLPVSMALHCLGCLIVATAAGAVCGYADSFPTLLAGILPVFVIVYVLVYALCIFLMKLEEKQINRALNEE